MAFLLNPAPMLMWMCKMSCHPYFTLYVHTTLGVISLNCYYNNLN